MYESIFFTFFIFCRFIFSPLPPDQVILRNNLKKQKINLGKNKKKNNEGDSFLFIFLFLDFTYDTLLCTFLQKFFKKKEKNNNKKKKKKNPCTILLLYYCTTLHVFSPWVNPKKKKKRRKKKKKRKFIWKASSRSLPIDFPPPQFSIPSSS